MNFTATATATAASHESAQAQSVNADLQRGCRFIGVYLDVCGSPVVVVASRASRTASIREHYVDGSTYVPLDRNAENWRRAR